MKWIDFDGIIKDRTGSNPKLKVSEYLPFGQIPVIDQGKEYISGYSNKENIKFKYSRPLIIFGDHTCIFKYIDFPFILGADGVKALEVQGENDTKFIYHYLATVRIPNTGYDRHYKYLKRIKIPIFPIETQRKIAAILDKADELMQNDKKILEKYDRLAQSVFLEMFGDPEKNSKNWHIKPFNFFARIDTKMTTNFKEFSELPHIGIGNIEQDSGRIQNIKLVKEECLISGKYIFSKDHIIYSKIRPNLNKVALPDFSGLCSADAYPILVDKTNTNRIFFAYVLRSKLFLEHILKHCQRTNIPKANKQQVESFYCIAPPKDMQDRFALIIGKIEEQKRLSQISLQKSEDLFQSLLQRAFRGEL